MSPQLEDGGITTTDMWMDFFDFGIDPEIDAPDFDEVFDGTALAEEAIKEH